jgi:hypothetical protein
MEIDKLKLTIEEVFEIINIIEPYIQIDIKENNEIDKDLLSAYNKLNEVEYEQAEPNYDYEIPEFIGIVKGEK